MQNGTRKRRTGLRVCLGVLTLCFILVIYTVLRAVNLDANLNYIGAYELPAFPKIGELAEVSYGQQAAAVDGTVIYEHNPSGEAVQPTASTTKMILSLAITERKPLNLGEQGETITITQDFYDRYAWYLANNGSTTAVEVGEEISEYAALASVLLASSNNIADSLAIWAFGSLDSYRDYAMEMLRNWGFTDTVLGPDASGYNAGTVSSARELALIGQKVLENPVLAEIVALKAYTVPVAGRIENTNQLLGENGVVGIKTGYIGEDVSGYCLISAYLYDGHKITLAVLGAPTRADSFSLSREMILELQDTLTLTTAVEAGETVGHLEAWWLSSNVPVKANENLEVLAWDGSPIEIANHSGSTLALSINHEIYETPITPDAYQAEPSFWDRVKKVWGFGGNTE